MIGFMDRTWCPAHGCAKAATCDRAITDEVIKKAKLWWGSSYPPITQYEDHYKLQCYEPRAKDTGGVGDEST